MQDADAQTRHLLRTAERDAETLIAKLRMFVALSLGIFFVFTVGPAGSAPSDVLARQWLFAAMTMTAYFLLGAATWWITTRGHYKGWMVWLTATADGLFLLINVWLSTFNTGMPGGHAFVFPSIWLAPMVLAFGVLRFQPAVQAYTVAIIVLGLLGIVALFPGSAGASGPRPVGIFLSDPPNYMRLAMLALAGIVLVVALSRSRMLLLRSLAEARRNANLTRYLPAQLAQRLGQGGLEELRRGRRHEMAILFVDMRGFTTMSQRLAPEELSRFVTEYRDRISRAAAAHGGIIDKFMGDAAMIVFDDDDHARAASEVLACADQIYRDVARWSDDRKAEGQSPATIGIGVHWGAVFSGVVGREDRLEYSVFGDTVNIASRLEQLTKDKGVPIIVSRAVLEAAGQDTMKGWTSLGRVTIRGTDTEVEVFGRSAP